jgi:hypothetical protein
VLIPGFGEVKQAALAAGALGCSISGAGPPCSPGRKARCGEGARGMVEAFRRHGLETDSWVSTIDRERRARGGRLMRFQSTRNAGAHASLSEAIARGLAPDGGLYVPERCRRLEPGDSTARDDARGGRACCSRRLRRATRSPTAPEITRDAFNFPVPARWRCRRGRAAVGARAVPRADRGVQGFRRTLPRGVRSSASRATIRAG